jgi:hypothetical protein
MRRNANEICPILLFAALCSLSGSARAQQEFDQQKAAKAIADSETFKDCHAGIDNWDACNWHIYTGRWSNIAEYWGNSTAHLDPDSLKGNPVGYWLYQEKGYLQLSTSPEMLTFSDKGRTASKDWERVTAPGSQADKTQGPFERWEVPLATKKLVKITGVLRGQQMGVQFAEVHYTWMYALTPLGTELFKNERIPSTGRGNRGGWIAPRELNGIDLNKTYDSKVEFFFHNGAWRLQENCNQVDICRLQRSVRPSV